jgi:hypothetical protein
MDINEEWLTGRKYLFMDKEWMGLDTGPKNYRKHGTQPAGMHYRCLDTKNPLIIKALIWVTILTLLISRRTYFNARKIHPGKNIVRFTQVVSRLWCKIVVIILAMYWMLLW